MLLQFLLALACVAGMLPSGRTSDERFITWKGDSYKRVEELWDPITREPKSKIPLPASRSWVEHVAWKPRVFIYHNFITELEAKHLIELAAPQMKRSTVVGAGGKSVEDSYRTSYGTFLRRYQDAVVERLENRVAAWTMIPVSHQEDIQVLRYGIGQQYRVHSDTLSDDVAGVRVATVLIYLNDPDEGGETAFPDSEWINPQLKERYNSNFSQCARDHVAFKPKRGDALLFWSIGPDGRSEDYHASHTGCPVISGVKWTVTKWIHARPFRLEDFESAVRAPKPLSNAMEDPGECVDKQRNCAEWALRGDCESNHDYMVVSAVAPGACRKACGACTVCARGDTECYNENRRKIGFLVFNATELRPFHDMYATT